MVQENLERMIRLADEFFEAKSDPEQISVDEETIKRLVKIHPATMTQKATAKGPVAWMLVIPTTRHIMKLFISRKINERALLEMTPVHETYEALYLCSALVLPEYRGKGLAKRLVCKAVKTIQKDHPIKFLFFWAFSTAGKSLADSVAAELGLPLYKRLARIRKS